MHKTTQNKIVKI